MKRDQLEIDGLNKRPDHPVLLECRQVTLLQLILWTRTFHDRHATEENEQVGASKDCLVDSNTSDNFEVFVLQHDLVLQKLVPYCCSGAKNGCEGGLN